MLWFRHTEKAAPFRFKDFQGFVEPHLDQEVADEIVYHFRVLLHSRLWLLWHPFRLMAALHQAFKSRVKVFAGTIQNVIIPACSSRSSDVIGSNSIPKQPHGSTSLNHIQ
jgi:hypothetical protein